MDGISFLVSLPVTGSAMAGHTAQRGAVAVERKPK